MDFIACGANRVPQVASVHGKYLVYASQSFLAFWKDNSVQKTLELDAQVTAVLGDGDYIVAATQAGTIYTYTNNILYKRVSLPKSVTCLASNGRLVAVGSSSGEVILYTLDSFSECRRVNLPAGCYPLCLAMADDILAIGGTSNSVFLYYSDKNVELKGHENWVRSLAFKRERDGYTLASASQDKYIRLWSVSRKETSSDPLQTGLSTRVHHLAEFSIVFDALLIGHDDWILSILWEPNGDRLLSASSDSSLIVWSPGSQDQPVGQDSMMEETLWTPELRLGDVSIMGASTATGASGGFWTALWLENINAVATVSKTGAFRLWSTETWKPILGLTGHFQPLTDVCWLGGLCLSSSLDQTARLWAPFQNTFREISRPQIHGYDMVAVSPISETCYISAGDEKVLRVFTMPQSVAQLLASLNLLDIPESPDSLPVSASVPALGLSNKDTGNENSDSARVPLGEFPREDQLQRLTLWPEIEKLYGHGYEVVCVDVSHSKELVATCCKANSAKHAIVRIYATDKWRQLEPLAGHTLTVNRLRFSPDDKYLLSVSRDRQWFLYLVDDMSVARSEPKAHSRILWDACWVSNTSFLTVSRDKTAKLWDVEGKVLRSAKFEKPLTACEYCSYLNILVVGLESGEIKLLDLELGELKTLKAEGRITRLSAHRTLLAVACSTLRIFPLDLAGH